MEIDSFDALLEAARNQPQPQRMLMVFARTVLPEDVDDEQRRRFEAGEGGGLVPVMYVDKTADELDGFAELVSESQLMSDDWQIVLVGCMDGSGGQPPSSDRAQEALRNIVKTIHAGGDLSSLAAFDREGWPIRFI